MPRVLNIIGTRPEAIKMAPVINELRKHPAEVETLVCVTGQHKEMLEPILTLFDIRPDYDLQVMRRNQTLTQLTADLCTGLDSVITGSRPDWVLAQGDTTTVLAAGLVAFYHRVRFGHVEAGLRTGDKHRPFPEEINRRIADVLADIYFAPTQGAREALLLEGAPPDKIHVTGNTVVDALLDAASRPYSFASGPLASLPTDKELVLITAHRRESFGQPFRDMCTAIRTLADRFRPDGFHFVYPVHLNPNVQEPVRAILGDVPNISLIEPLDYLSQVHLMKRAALILTDSGGIQEEAPSLRVPVLVMRDTTERPEGVEAGAVRLVGTAPSRITAEAARLLSSPDERARMQTARNPYGDGKAAQRIAQVLLSHSHP